MVEGLLEVCSTTFFADLFDQFLDITDGPVELVIIDIIDDIDNTLDIIDTIVF